MPSRVTHTVIHRFTWGYAEFIQYLQGKTRIAVATDEVDRSVRQASQQEKANTMTTTYQLQLSVRDYECDMQGVVNNAVYQNYLEHARHEFLKLHGLDFAALTKAGINLVVVRAELDYKGSLTSGDNFTVNTWLEQQSRLKFVFKQQINRDADGKLMLDALITGTGVNAQGKPFLPEQLLPLMRALTHQS